MEYFVEEIRNMGKMPKQADEENQFRKSSNEYGKQNVDLNTSDYRYND